MSNIRDILLRISSHADLDTKGSDLANTEMDANIIAIYEALAEIIAPRGYNTWAFGTNYNNNEYSVFENQLYRSIQDSNQGNSPDASPLFWEFVDITEIMDALRLVVIRRLELQTKRNSQTLIPGTKYFIADLEEPMILEAITIDAFAIGGVLAARNPDHQGVGNYAGVEDETSIAAGNLLGIWEAGLETASPPAEDGDIVIWDNYHYQVTNDAAFNGSSPALNGSAYTQLPKTAANVGYIKEYDEIHIKATTNLLDTLFTDANLLAGTIAFRKDKRMNQIHNPSGWAWGNNKVLNNIVAQGATITNNNFIGEMTGVHFFSGLSTEFDNTDDNTYTNIRFDENGAGGFIKKTFTFTDFSIAATSNTINSIPLPKGYIITQRTRKIITAFSGGGAGSAELQTGLSGGTLDAQGSPDNISVFTGAAVVANAPVFQDNSDANQQITETLTSDVNLNTLVAGQVDIYYKLQKVY
jgi:hypothetical protein